MVCYSFRVREALRVFYSVPVRDTPLPIRAGPSGQERKQAPQMVFPIILPISQGNL